MMLKPGPGPGESRACEEIISDFDNHDMIVIAHKSVDFGQARSFPRVSRWRFDGGVNLSRTDF